MCPPGGYSETSAAGGCVYNIDRKALLVFAALLKEGNVTRVAQQLEATQSSVSHTLAKLRELFGDPLFVSAGRGIVPTPRALELREPLQHVLDAMDALVQSSRPFDPAAFEGVFRIATTDYIGFILLPGLVRRLSEASPALELQIRPLRPSEDMDALRRDEVDLVLWNEKSAPQNFFSRKLFSDRLKAIARIDHPEIQGSLSLEQFRAARHLRISSQHGAVKEPVEEASEKYKARGKTAVVVPHFLLAYKLVAESNLIGTIAELTAKRIARELPLQILDPPVDQTRFTVSMVWHERRNSDAAHRWIRGEVIAVADAIQAEQGL